MPLFRSRRASPLVGGGPGVVEPNVQGTLTLTLSFGMYVLAAAHVQSMYARCLDVISKLQETSLCNPSQRYLWSSERMSMLEKVRD